MCVLYSSIMKRLVFSFLIILSVASCKSEVIENFSGFEARVDSLLSQLTIEEKASLMMNSSPAVPHLGIKTYDWWNEALHGVARNGSATVFPQPVGMAASFDDELLYEVFTAVSDEARVKHRMAKEEGELKRYQGLTFWTPNINIFRDPRWGRGMETYGEDPYLTGVLGMAVVRGLQGDDDSPVRKAHACAKHYAVHSGPESNRHSFDVSVSERDLRETYLPAFKDLVMKAGVEEVMTAYNRVDGVPAGASDRLMNDILRNEWGFKGIITSDCWAVNDFFMPDCHGYSPDAASAAAVAVKMGMNTECGDAFRFIPEAVERGLLTEAEVDKCLRELLLDRFELGEMDDVSLWDHLPEDIVEGPEHRALSLKMAEECIVLLQNKDDILPLSTDSKIALIGPNADDEEMMWGNYNPVPESTVTLLEAMQERVPGLVYSRGCGHVDEGFTPELIQQLENVDIVVFAGGISPRLEGEEMAVEVPGFMGGDRTDIELPLVQRELLELLHDLGKKVVLVNFSGSAMGLVPETATCDAIVQAWYPGQEGGTALASILFGDVNPSGKLPLTFYKSVDQIPHFENYDMEGRTYRYFRGEPLYEFGFGLSYTQFEYGQAKVRRGRIIVPVTNTGDREGEEVVQLYVRRPDDPQGPEKTLRGFKRVSVPAGKTVKVEIPLTDETFLWWNEQEQDMTPLPGGFELMYGGSSADESLQTVSYLYGC